MNSLNKRLFSFSQAAILLLMALTISLWAETSVAFAKLTILNLPTEATVLINNIETKSDGGAEFKAKPGLVTVQVEYKGVAAYTASFYLNADEEQTINLDCQDRCATLDIVTDPFGASVNLNNKFKGLTPFVSSFMNPGEYELSVSMPGYKPTFRTLTITGIKPTMMTITLEHTQAFSDSLKTILHKQKKSRQFVQKLLCSGLALACSAGGVYFDMNAKSNLADADNATLSYDRAKGDFQQYHAVYNDDRSAAQKALNNRNILYAAAGVCVVGFAVSFLF